MTNDNAAQANAPALSRRTFVALAAAPALACAPAMAAPVTGQDPHAEWFEQWKALRDHVNNSGDDYDDHSDELHRLEGLICETQPTTKEGAAAQLEYAMDDFGEYMIGNIWHDLDRKLFNNLLAGIRGGLV